jgi:hypothetical protein
MSVRPRKHRTPIVRTIRIRIDANSTEFKLKKEHLIDRKGAIRQMKKMRDQARAVLSANQNPDQSMSDIAFPQKNDETHSSNAFDVFADLSGDLMKPFATFFINPESSTDRLDDTFFGGESGTPAYPWTNEPWPILDASPPR